MRLSCSSYRSLIRSPLVWDGDGDGAAGEHDHGGCGVESVGPRGHPSHFRVQALRAAVVDADAEGGEDPGAVLADGATELDERREPGPWRPSGKRSTRRAASPGARSGWKIALSACTPWWARHTAPPARLIAASCSVWVS